MRKRIPDPKPPRTKPKTAEDWYDVQYMDVYSQETKKGDMAVVVSFRVEDEEYPVRVWYLPRHKHPFVLQKYADWYEQLNAVLEAEGLKPFKPEHDAEKAVEQAEGWPMPYRIGCTEEFEGGHRNIEVVEYDWTGEQSHSQRVEDVDTTHASQAASQGPERTLSKEKAEAFKGLLKTAWLQPATKAHAQTVCDELGLSPRDEKTWTDDLLETAMEMILKPAPPPKVDDDDLPF